MELRQGTSLPTSPHRPGTNVEPFYAMSTGVAIIATANYLVGASGKNIPNLALASSGKEVCIQSIQVTDGGSANKGVFRVYIGTTASDLVQIYGVALSGGHKTVTAPIPEEGWNRHVENGHIRIINSLTGITYFIAGYTRNYKTLEASA